MLLRVRAAPAERKHIEVKGDYFKILFFGLGAAPSDSWGYS